MGSIAVGQGWSQIVCLILLVACGQPPYNYGMQRTPITRSVLRRRCRGAADAGRYTARMTYRIGKSLAPFDP
jgi:hypothetical protein